ncbi:MAG TPA: phage major capsid protein [Candidatus Acidoferrales bacterium]|nr:phage major capsid protein [Candidatus Acidoferrales bacterium]
MAVPNYALPINNIVSSTLDAKLDSIVDNFFNTNALFQKLYQRMQGNGNGRTVKYAGGAEIRTSFWYNGMPAYSYGPGGTFGTGVQQFQTDMQFQWRQAAAELNIDGLDKFRNQGNLVQLFDYVETAATNSFDSLANLLGYMIFGTQPNPSTGVTEARTFTATDWDGIYNGIKATGTYGGITRGATFGTPGYAIRANVIDALNAPLSFPLMQQAYGAATFMPAAPDLIATTQNLFNQIWNRSQPSERNAPGPLRDVGFDTVRFNKAEVIVDSHCLPGDMWFMNTEFIELWIGEGNDFIRRSRRDGFPDGYPNPVQDSYVDQVIVYGDLIVTGPRFQAAVHNIAE